MISIINGVGWYVIAISFIYPVEVLIANWRIREKIVFANIFAFSVLGLIGTIMVCIH